MELSYSFHLGSDKNRKQSTKGMASDNPSGTSSLSNNGIQNATQLSKVDKHNLRKYDNNPEQIVILRGSNNLYKDTQELYLKEFEEARLEYNAKMTRKDRIISNYFDHVKQDKLRDLACQIIIEIGDKDFWQGKDDTYRKKMSDVFNEQIKELEKLVPSFRVANAVIHFDETSPHMHIVGFGVCEDNKVGLKKQVTKSKIFTKESLTKIQDKMRDACIKSFNKFYDDTKELKEKQKGRNQDLPVKEMAEYKEFKRKFDQKQKQQALADKKVDTLIEKGNSIDEKLKLLKPQTLNKGKYTITQDDVDTIRGFVKATKDTTKVVKEANKINNLVNKAEYQYNDMSSRNFFISEELKEAKEEIEDLKYKLDEKDTIIERLEKEVEKFKGLYEKFKNFWKGIIGKFQEKIGYDKSQRYKDIAKELYEDDVITKRDKEIMEDPDRVVITEEELTNKQKMKGAR